MTPLLFCHKGWVLQHTSYPCGSSDLHSAVGLLRTTVCMLSPVCKVKRHVTYHVVSFFPQSAGALEEVEVTQRETVQRSVTSPTTQEQRLDQEHADISAICGLNKKSFEPGNVFILFPDYLNFKGLKPRLPMQQKTGSWFKGTLIHQPQ